MSNCAIEHKGTITMSISPEQKHDHDLPSLDETFAPPAERQWDGPDVQARFEASKRKDKENKPRRRTLKVALASLLALGIGGGGVALGNHLSNSRATDAPVDEPTTNPDAQNGGITTDPTTGESSITIQTPPSSVESSPASAGVEIAATREASIDLLAKLNTTTTPEMNEYMMSHPITQAEFPTAKDAAPALLAYLNAYGNGGISTFDTLIDETSASKKQGSQIFDKIFDTGSATSVTDWPKQAQTIRKNRTNIANMRNGVANRGGNADDLKFNTTYDFTNATYTSIDSTTTRLDIPHGGAVITSNAQEVGIDPSQLKDSYVGGALFDVVLEEDGTWKLAQDPSWTPDL